MSFVYSGVSCSTGYLIVCFMGSGIRPCLCFECALVACPRVCVEGQGRAGHERAIQCREGQGREGRTGQGKGGQDTADQSMLGNC